MGINNIFSSIKSIWQEQQLLLREFYHLDYWDDHTLVEGFSEAMQGATEWVEVALKDKNRVLQSVAGAGMGVARLLGAIPLGLNDYMVQVGKELPQGLDKALYKLVEIPVMGFWRGGMSVCERIHQWTEGDLNNKDSFSIANEVTTTLGTAALLLFGAQKIVEGGGQFLSGMKTTTESLAVQGTQNGMAFATVTVSTAVLAGGSNFLTGIVLMSSGGGSKPFVDNDTLSGVLKRHQGDRVQAAKETGLKLKIVRYRIRTAGEKSPLAPFKKFPEKRRNVSPISEEALVALLQRYRGNRAKVAKKLRVSYSTVSNRIKRAKEGSLLSPFKQLKGKGGWGPPRVSDKALAKALEKHQGYRLKVSREIGINPSGISKRVGKASDNSPLAPFKNIKGNPHSK